MKLNTVIVNRKHGECYEVGNIVNGATISEINRNDKTHVIQCLDAKGNSVIEIGCEIPVIMI